MLRLIALRLLWSIPLLLVVSAAVFILQSLIPGDAAVNLAGITATPQDIATLREHLHLNEPVYVQYATWLSQAVRGDLGTSLGNGEPVSTALSVRLAVTLPLVLIGTVLAAVVGVLFGVVSSLGGRVARIVSDVISIAGMALPSFFVALLLIAIFSVTLGWFPSNGYVPFTNDPGQWALSFVLPVVALAFNGITAIAKVTREGMLDTMQRDFIRNLRANGMNEGSVVFRHALRSASLPVVTIVGLSFVSSLSSAVVIEQVFGLPGLGGLAVSATFSHDIPLIQGVAVYFTLIVIAMNLLLDIAFGWLNPRVRVA